MGAGWNSEKVNADNDDGDDDHHGGQSRVTA